MATTARVLDRQELDAMVDELLADFPPDRTEPEVFWGEQFDRGLGVGALPRRARRPRGLARAAGTGAAADPQGRCDQPGPPQHHRVRDGGAHVGRPRHRRADRPLPAADLHLRGDLVPALLRAGRRLGRGQPRHAGGARRRRVGDQRAEGVDHGRAPRSASDSCWPAPTPTSRSTGASPASWSTCRRRGWRCGRSTRSPVRRSSTRSSSPTHALPTPTVSAGWARVGASPSRPS